MLYHDGAFRGEVVVGGGLRPSGSLFFISSNSTPFPLPLLAAFICTKNLVKASGFPHLQKNLHVAKKKTSISGGNSRKSHPEAFSSRNLLINLTGRLSQTPFRMHYLLLFLRLPPAPLFILSTFKATLMVLGRAGEKE